MRSTPSMSASVRAAKSRRARRDRKSTRLNSSHSQISYAVFCLKKKKKKRQYIIHTFFAKYYPPPTSGTNSIFPVLTPPYIYLIDTSIIHNQIHTTHV